MGQILTPFQAKILLGLLGIAVIDLRSQKLQLMGSVFLPGARKRQ